MISVHVHAVTSCPAILIGQSSSILWEYKENFCKTLSYTNRRWQRLYLFVLKFSLNTL
jgi:hypothetical protein